MTLRNIYESVLIELDKVNAPSLLISDFIYLFNKAVLIYINTRYLAFDVTQQFTDDLRVLTKTEKISNLQASTSSDPVFKGNYSITLPDDYWHILNCVCEFEAVNNPICEDCGGYVLYGANKLNSNLFPHAINNYYMKPSYKRPYYYITNIQNPLANQNGSVSTDQKNTNVNNKIRYGNATNPIMLIKCGSEKKYKLHAVYIDYLRAPEYVAFTQALLDDPVDNTQAIEFPDYVVYEIINVLVSLAMENHSDTRMQTYLLFNLSTIPTQK